MNELIPILEQMRAGLVTIEDAAQFIVSNNIHMSKIEELFNMGTITFMEHRTLKSTCGNLQGFKRFRILGEEYGYVEAF